MAPVILMWMSVFGLPAYAAETKKLENKGTETMHIKLADDVMVALGPGTFAQVEKDEGKPLTLNLIRGAVAAVVNSSTKKESFRLKTRTSVMGVRGTRFFVSAPATGPVTTCICKGTVTVRATKSSGRVETFTSTHHDNIVAVAETGILSRTSDVPAHSDEDAESMEKLLHGEN
jgi:hypothetical protein